MRQLVGPLLFLLVCPIAATQINLARANSEALFEPPYECFALQRWNNAEWEALVTSAVPGDGPLLIPVFLAELNLNGSQTPPTRPALQEVMQDVTVTVLDAAGSLIEGESGGEVDAEGRTTHRLWSWRPEAPLSPGDYSVKLTGPETITWGDCNVHFTPFELSVTIGTTLADLVNAAELTLSDSWEVMRALSDVDCCAVVPAEGASGQGRFQCWNHTTSSVVGAEWTGDGLLWLDMAILPTAGELVGLGDGDGAVAQYDLLEFGEVCVEGTIGPTGEPPARVVERCANVASSRHFEVEGRTRVNVGSCIAAPDVPAGTRGLLVIRAETEEGARNRIESSSYVVGKGFVEMNTDEPATGGATNTIEADASTSILDAESSAPDNSEEAVAVAATLDPATQPAPTSGQFAEFRQPSSGCSIHRRGSSTRDGWLLMLAVCLASGRRTRR